MAAWCFKHATFKASVGAVLLPFAKSGVRRRHGNRDVDRVTGILLNATCDRVAFWRVGITRLSVHVLCKHKQCCFAAVKEGDLHQVRAL